MNFISPHRIPARAASQRPAPRAPRAGSWRPAVALCLGAFCLQVGAAETPLPASTNAPAQSATNPPPAAAAAPGRRETNAPARVDFASFKIITDRNIFDPSRSPRRASTGSGSRATRRTVRTEGFTLVGTAVSSSGPVAFFDGTESKYRKKLKPAETIGSFQIVEIAPTYVTLQAEGKEVKLLTPPAQSQMRKQDDGPWELVSGGAAEKLAAASGSEDSATAEKSDADSSGAPTGNTATDEILRKLMQQREQELKNEKP